MKATLLTLGLLFSISSFANCSGEAQLSPSNVVKVVQTQDSCRVFVDHLRLNDNPMCPLDDSSVSSRGIEVDVDANGKCEFQVGQKVSGYLVNDGQNVVLE